MRWNSPAAALAANVVSVLSATPTVQQPCAQVSVALTKKSPVDPNGNIMIDADLAYACLKSVPVDKAGDLSQLEGMKTLVNFQSDLVYLKSPPPGFLYPGVDILGSLDAMISKLQSGGYSSEYDVQLDLYNLITSAYDFHLVYQSDIMEIFAWLRPVDLVSVSVDGTSLPNIYNALDVGALAGSNGTSYKPSPVVQINNTDVEEWLNQYAASNPWDHDPDVNYNTIFFSPPALIPGQPASFSQSSHFPGSETVLKYANGTTANVKSYAVTVQDFTGVTSGSTFFQKFCSGPQPSASASTSASASGIPSASASGSASAVASSSVTTNNLYTALATPLPSLKAPTFYPAPAVIASDGYMGGYFPESLPDLAVVAMPSFEPTDNYAFQNAFRTILATAKALGKSRLIIDVRANGGGNVVDAFGLFKQLFPSMTAYGGSNMAAWPLFNAIGEVVSGYTGNALYNSQPLSEFSVQEDLNVNLDDFSSWADFYGPVQHYGGNFTNVKRYNYSSPDNSLGSTLYGYGNDTKPQPQTFSSDNIVLLSDGSCGSTCAIFAELLKTQGNVKSITVGGRKQYGPTQPVGGSKGSNDQHLAELLQVGSQALKDADSSQKALFEPYVKAGLAQNAEQLINRLSSVEGGNVNFQNNIRKGDDSDTPLMFVYEASNCRFFYTPQMIGDQTLVWAYTYNLQWGNGTCVKDSTGAPSAATGYSTSYIHSAPPAGAKNFFGANVTWSYPGAYGSEDSLKPSASPSASGTSTTATKSPAAATSSSAASSSRGLLQLGPWNGWAVSGLICAASWVVGIAVFLL